MNTKPHKRHGLTQLGNEQAQPVYYRRGTHCPVMVFIRRANEEKFTKVPGWLINISEDSCLISSDHFPKKAYEIRIQFPGLSTKFKGKARKQGEFTILVQFSNDLPTRIVDKIALISQKSAD